MTPENQLADKHRAELDKLPSSDRREIEDTMMEIGPRIMVMRHVNAERLLRMLSELEAVVSR